MRRIICSLPEVYVNMEAPPVVKICARVRLTSKNPLKGKAVLLGVGQFVGVHPVNVFSSRIPPVGESCKTKAGIFVGVVPVQPTKFSG